MDENSLFTQALIAIEAGDRALARRLLANLVRGNPRHELAWLRLASVVDDRHQVADCLQRVLAINPNNVTAREWLDQVNRVVTQPFEARAIRLALEFVGPMIAAGSSSPLDRVRMKLEDAFGQFDLTQTPTPQAGAEEDLVATLTRAIDRKRLVELEYLKPESTEVETRTIEPYGIERRLPHWYVHTWDVDRDAPRSYRLDRTRTAKELEREFAPREGFDRSELHEATTARI